MASKAIYSAVAVVGIAAASAGAWWYQARPQGPVEIKADSGAAAAAGKTAAAAPSAASSAPRAAGVEVAKAERARLQDDAQSVGTLRSRQSVMLRPEVAGRVREIGFADGAVVRKGQVLVQLDDTLQKAEIKQAQAQVSIAQANLKRNQELVAQSFVAQRVLDESGANLQVAEAQLALACARWSRMAILAPFDGTVGIRSVNLGDYVKDGADLVNLEDISSMYADFRLPERFQGKLRARQSVQLQLDAYPGRVFKASIEAIDPLLDVNGRSVGVRAVLPNTMGEAAPQGGGRPGGPGGAPAAAGGGAAKPPAAAGLAGGGDRKSNADGARGNAPMTGAAGNARAPGGGQRGAGAGAPGRADGVRAGGGRSATPEAALCGSVTGGESATVAAESQNRAAGGAAAGGGSGPRAGAAGGQRGAGGPGAMPLRPGMFARVTTIFAIKDAAIVIPEEAIVPQGGRQFVIKVMEPSQVPAAADRPLPPDTKWVSQRQEVKLGARQLGKVEVVEGLLEGETVVVAGQQRLQRDGTALRIVELGRPGPRGGPAGATPPAGATSAPAPGNGPAMGASAPGPVAALGN
jgi:multidrug efflux pump subunit AcrA (membrane-fusion protein)